MKTYPLVLFLIWVIPGYSQTLEGEQKEMLLREADAVWSRRVWQIIDLREKMNQIFYAPSQPTGMKKNLMLLLQEAIMNGYVAVYDPLYDDFRVKLSPTEIKAMWTEKIKRTFEKPYPPYEQYDSVIAKTFDPKTIKKIKLKEEWYYNKNSTKMEVKIIGICPVRERYDEQTGTYLGYMDMFWIYFPELRFFLYDKEVLSPFTINGRVIRTFDDVFRERYFSSFIYKEDNVFDRRVEDYTKYGLDNLLESERIRNSIRDSEDGLGE